MALNPPAASIPAMVLQRAAANPSAPILRKKQRGIWKSVSWAELAQRMQHAGVALQAIGLRPGDIAAVLAETRPEWVTADLGILSAGGTSFGIPPDSSSEQVSDRLRESGCRVLFVENEEQLDKALAARERCPALHHIVIFDMVGLRDFADPACESFADFLARGARADEARLTAWRNGVAAITEHHPALLQDSTGRPMMHGEVLRRIADLRARLTTRPGDERLALLPMAAVSERVFGLYAALDAGIISNYLENPDTTIENLQELQPTVLVADAAAWTRLHGRITEAEAAATPVQRGLYRLALAAGRHGGLTAWLARAFVLRAVRRELGLARLRIAISGDALAPEVKTWAAALGMTVVPLDTTPSSEPAANKRYGAISVEA